MGMLYLRNDNVRMNQVELADGNRA